MRCRAKCDGVETVVEDFGQDMSRNGIGRHPGVASGGDQSSGLAGGRVQQQFAAGVQHAAGVDSPTGTAAATGSPLKVSASANTV